MLVNWILGGGIVALTVFIIVRKVIQFKKGESGCCGCTSSKNGCHCNHEQ